MRARIQNLGREIGALTAAVASQGRLPSLCWSIADSGGCCLSGAAGDAESPGATRFPIASATKPFTARMCVQLMQAAGLPLKTPVTEILPDFSLQDARAGRLMTVEDLLCHRSGLPPHTWAWVPGELDRGTFIRERLPHLAPVGAHDEGYRYSNLLYAVAGQVCAQLGGGSDWEDLLQKHFLAPLEMRASGLLEEDWPDISGMAVPFGTGGESLPPFVAKRKHLIAPASEMYSSAEDLGRWLSDMLREYPADSYLYRPRELISETRPHAALGPLHYALGWRVDTFRGHAQVWHSGQCSGYTALTALLPERGIGIALLCNRSGALGRLQALLYSLYDLQLEHSHTEPIDWIDLLEAPPEKPAPASAPPSAPDLPVLPQGLFQHPGYGPFEILPGSQVARYQKDCEGGLTPSTKGWRWSPDAYRQHFPLHYEAATQTLHIAFEPQLDPIPFSLQMRD